MVYKDNRVVEFNKPLYFGSNALDIYSLNIYYLIEKTYGENVDNYVQFPNNGIGHIQNQFLNLVKQENIIIAGVPIIFSDNFWNFNNLFVEGKSSNIYGYYFNGAKNNFRLTDSFVIVLKLYTWHLISSNGIHQSSNKMKVDSARAFLSYLSEKKFTNLRDVTCNDFDDYIQSNNCNYSTRTQYLYNIKSFYNFYSQMAENIYTDDFVDYFNTIDLPKKKAVNAANKATLLPTLFYRKFTQMIFDFTMNPTNSLRERGIAGLLYIGTQTGLRTSELQILKKDCVVPIYHEGNLAHKLNYLVVKNGKHGKHKQEDTIANDKVKEMVDFLHVLFADFRKGTDYLVPAISKGNTLNNRPPKKVYCNHDLIHFLTKFCIINCKELGVFNTVERNMFDGSYSILIDKGKDIAKIAKNMGLTEDDLISYPRIRQFRVYFATDYNKKGYGHKDVAGLLGHDSVEMWGYYYRETEGVHKSINFKSEIPESVRNPYSDNDNQDPKHIKDKVDSFLKFNTINVRKDIHDVIDSVNGSLPVTLERGGMCIKNTSRRLCPKSMDRDELISIFGIVDHSAFFFMVPPVYHVYKQLIETIKYNKTNNFINQSQKEMYRMGAVINNLLLPTIQDLEKELSVQGSDVLIESHPDLSYIISHLNEIKEDIQSWKLRIEELN